MLRSSNINDVVTESPGGGTRLALTSPVQLYLQASNCATMPDLLGVDLANADADLEILGFKVIDYQNECAGSALTDLVVTQSPSPGTSYPKNQLVSFKTRTKNCL